MRAFRTAVPAVALAAALTAVTAGAAGAAPTAPAAQDRPAGDGRLGPCAAGQLCLWPKPGFQGNRRVSELAGIQIESCTTLPQGTSAASFANRMGRPVTLYQSATCAETGEFATYPSGTWVPEAAYPVRAYKVWES
ncbi:hypothetical protein GCM10010218_14570 [Streptomyces mashuensis]|uniref:Peptidase inhibitor family I36 n=1 Tax=Streptomyces mashuensis TaxID=33904 RepID=A0A919B027_9ACTN|nr:peptidase inhibitor family I36 protein [Streptomyces mashuensis]GHF34495.1 hypothetical protein GCM10010218_14570 [Streptomyces mashuensis]